jgi:hypothetical protein
MFPEIQKVSYINYLVWDIVMARCLFFGDAVDDVIDLGGGYCWEVEWGIKREGLDVVHGNADWDI